MKIKLNFKPTKKKIISCIIYLAIIAAGITLDRLTKALAVKFLKDTPAVPVINGVLEWKFHTNPGAAWGSFVGNEWVLLVLPTIAIFAMLLYLYFTTNENPLYMISVSLIASGGAGNMIDRVAYGEVVDFIHTVFIEFPIFNVADSIVCIGAALLILALILDIVKEGKKVKSDRNKGEEE